MNEGFYLTLMIVLGGLTLTAWIWCPRIIKKIQEQRLNGSVKHE